jgi:hypothetical protein
MVHALLLKRPVQVNRLDLAVARSGCSSSPRNSPTRADGIGAVGIIAIAIDAVCTGPRAGTGR